MRKPVKVFRFTFLYLFFYFICISYSMLYASSTEEDNTTKIPKWSLEFNDCSVSDALNQISKVTGVKVITNIDIEKMVLNKYYKDKPIDHIVTDILSRENYAIIRRFSDKRKLVSIGIWILDWSNGRGSLGLAMLQSKEGIKHGSATTTNNSFINAIKNSPIEASRIERKNNAFINAIKNNPIEANRTEKNVKNGNNPFTTKGK